MKRSQGKVKVENRHVSPRKQAALNLIYRSKAVVINKKKPLPETCNEDDVGICLDKLEEEFKNLTLR